MDNKDTAAVVLVVDDDPLVRKGLSVLVGTFGYHCLLAGDGLEALAVLQSTAVDLVLSDIVMPGMDGLALLARIRAQHSQTDVIIATGFDVRGSYAEVIKAGAIDFIKKPIDPPELEAKLARALRERALVRRLEQLSKEDTLTGLLNRRAFDEFFPAEVERAHRQGYALMLAMLDVDNFKDYNDTFGHQGGDMVLVELAKILKQYTRGSADKCFRFGGDEFALILPQTTPEQGNEIVQRILLSFGEKNFAPTSLSIGLVSCYRNPGLPSQEDEAAMVQRADRAMYEAKERGKNCVVARI
jgi:two-component system, cell cycle response regulator